MPGHVLRSGTRFNLLLCIGKPGISSQAAHQRLHRWINLCTPTSQFLLVSQSVFVSSLCTFFAPLKSCASIACTIWRTFCCDSVLITPEPNLLYKSSSLF